MKIATLSTGDSLYRYDRTIVLPFDKPRKVLSTSLFQGGYHENLTAVYNHNSDSKKSYCKVENYYDDMRAVAISVGLDPDTVSGMGTAVSMENAVIKTEIYEGLTVTAIATGGVEVNGGRVGDPANYYQPIDKEIFSKPGTINIILVLDCDLPPSMLARALVTCTEAKTAALQELMVGSNYSHGLATGSGTDQTIVIANPVSEIYLLSAGKHSKVGELIGKTVKEAVKEALLRHSGLSPQMQHRVLRRLKRFGVNGEKLLEKFIEKNHGVCTASQFYDGLGELDINPELVTYTSLFVHLLDQYSWDLLSCEEVRNSGGEIMALMADKFNIPPILINGSELVDFLQAWENLMLEIIKENM